MGKIFFIFLSTLFFLSYLHTEEFDSYSQELIKIIKIGNDKYELGYIPRLRGVPTGIGIDNEGNFFICDSAKVRLVLYNSNHCCPV